MHVDGFGVVSTGSSFTTCQVNMRSGFYIRGIFPKRTIHSGTKSSEKRALCNSSTYYMLFMQYLYIRHLTAQQPTWKSPLTAGKRELCERLGYFSLYCRVWLETPFYKLAGQSLGDTYA
jgi:hypothetical protein